MTRSTGAALKPLELTRKDEAILTLLRQDARRTVSEIASIVGLSRASVTARIDLMRERGVIKRFTVELEERHRDDTISESAFFLVRTKKPVCRVVYAAISQWPELKGCWSIAGDLDMVVLVDAPSNAEIERLRDKLARHPEVTRLQTLSVLRDWIGQSRSLHPKAAALLNQIAGAGENAMVGM